jgi:hypothetical protein
MAADALVRPTLDGQIVVEFLDVEGYERRILLTADEAFKLAAVLDAVARRIAGRDHSYECEATKNEGE